MNDKDKFSNQNQRAKKNSLDEAILGGFKSSAKRFAEYRQNSNAPDDWKGTTVASAPDEQAGKTRSRREWVERLFQLFDQYSQDFNKLVDEPHLISACYPPREQANENPLISRTQGLVSTKHWALLVRLQKEGIAGFLLPKTMEQTFLREESLFERIFLIESQEEYEDVWSYDGKPTDYSQLPTLARRFFGSLIEIARNEEDMDEEDEYSQPEMNSSPGSGVNEPVAAISGEQAVFKDLLNFGQIQGGAPGQEWTDQSEESGLSGLLKDESERRDLASGERSRANGEGERPPVEQTTAPEVEQNSYWSKSGGHTQTTEVSAYRMESQDISENTEAGAYRTERQEINVPTENRSLWKESGANTEELEMLKTDELTIASACEMMRHSIDKELEAITRTGMRAFENQDLGAIEKAMKRTKKVKEFKEQLSPVLSMWERLEHEEE